MTAALDEVIGDIADRLANVQDLRQAFAFDPGSVAPVAPCAVVEPGDGDFLAYDPSMASESVDYLIDVTLFVSATDTKAGQAQLSKFLRPSGVYSVRAAIAGSNSSLGVSYAVLRASAFRLVAGDGDAKYLSSTISVRVIA